MRRCDYACGTREHALSRRSFLAGAASAAAAAALPFGGGLSTLAQPAVAADLQSRQRQFLVLWLYGGVSQLETWDPKHGTDTGGPFRSIETSVPGIRISELLPRTAKLMHLMTLVRGVNTGEDDHGRGDVLMQTGRPQMPGVQHPHLGSLMSRFLTAADNPLPGYINVAPYGSGAVNAADAAFLGPKYGSMTLTDGKAPANLDADPGLEPGLDAAREALRKRLNERFARSRRSALTDAYTATYDQARQLMERKEVFDLSKEPARDVERYGSHDLGRHCLMARRLLMSGVTFVKVSHTNYDTHNENFDFHLEQLDEFDRPFAALLEDLHVSGMLEHTTVVVKSEFGRTPNINHLYGRDHWSKAWSIAVAGAGFQKGTVYGATNDRGTEVVDGQVSAADLFHTYLRAAGIDPTDDYSINGRDVQIADPRGKAIEEILA